MSMHVRTLVDRSSAIVYVFNIRHGRDDMQTPPDTCDCCGCAMKHKRLGARRASYLFVCEDCRVTALARLGNAGVTCTHVGIKL